MCTEILLAIFLIFFFYLFYYIYIFCGGGFCIVFLKLGFLLIPPGKENFEAKNVTS